MRRKNWPIIAAQYVNFSPFFQLEYLENCHFLITNYRKLHFSLSAVGMGLGNAWSHPYTQIEFSQFTEEVGIVDEKQRMKLEEYSERCRQLVEQERWREATDVR